MCKLDSTGSSAQGSIWLRGARQGAVGGRLRRKGICVYMQLIPVVVQQRLNIVKQLYFNDKSKGESSPE